MISGSGSQMQGTSYLPGYYHVIDHNVGGSGSLWRVLNNGTTCKIGRVYDVLREPSGSDPYLAYNKGILRQTMLKHEAIFRNQVHELHRLYGRQRELMNEMSKNHPQMQTSQYNLIPSKMHCNTFRKGLHIPCPLWTSPGDGKPPAQGGENFQMPSTFVSQESTKAGSNIYLKENHLVEQKVSSSKSHYFGKRLLDLELPAEEYISEEEQLEDGNSVQALQVQYDPPSKSATESPSKSNLKLNEASSSNGSSNCRKTTFLFDLNEPIQLDESSAPNSANFVDSSIETMPQDQDSFAKSKSESPVQNEESTYNVLEGKGNEGSSLISGLQDSSSGGSPLLCGDRSSLGSEVAKKDNEIFDDNNQSILSSCINNSCAIVLISNDAKTKASTSVSSQRTSFPNFGEIPSAIQALPCFNNPELLGKTSGSSSSNSGIKRQYCNSKRNPSCSPSLESLSCCVTGNGGNKHVEHNSVEECIKDSNHAKSSEDADLNAMPHSCLPETVGRRTNGANSSENSKGQFKRPRVKPDYDGTNLEAPVSPDNKEHPPPRGASEENQIEMPFHFSKQKTIDPNEDFDRIAAEAIISISLSGVQQYPWNDNTNGCLEVSSDCLSWFAGIVSSVTGDQEIKFGKLSNDAPSNDHNVLAASEIEHIEATAFKLTGMKVEDQFPKSLNQKSKAIAGIMLPGHQQENGQDRKTRQRKRFLSGLPCVASVPSSDVAENLQLTDQLITAAGATSGTITGQRNNGRNGRVRRSRHLKIVSSSVMKRRVCSLLKQHTSENELNFTLRSLLGWGRKRRRQKSRRARAKYCLRLD